MSEDLPADEFDESPMALLPGIISAVREDRSNDAEALADDLLDRCGDDVSAVLAVASFADFLHQHPEVPIEQVGMMISAHAAGMELTIDQTDGELVAELLDVIADITANNEPSAESQQVLDRWGSRYSSTALFGLLCRAVAIMLDDMKLQMSAPLAGLRSPEAAQRFAIADARSVLVDGRELNLFDSNWNDGGVSEG